MKTIENQMQTQTNIKRRNHLKISLKKKLPYLILNNPENFSTQRLTVLLKQFEEDSFSQISNDFPLK